jgi:hypothetical protein
MRKGFVALLLCGPLALSGCTDTEVKTAETTIQSQASPTTGSESQPSPNPVPVSKLQGCEFNGKKLTGKVYFTDNSNLTDTSTMYIGPEPRPNLVINETNTSLNAELRVYLNSSGTIIFDSGKCGVWQISNSPSGADWVVHITDDLLIDADITVLFVSEPIFAGPGGL